MMPVTELALLWMLSGLSLDVLLYEGVGGELVHKEEEETADWEKG